MAGPVRPQYGPDMLAFWPACRSGLEHRGRAECSKAPFMYEMKGALSGRAAPDLPVAWLPRHRPPPAGAKHPREPPVSRLFPCPRGYPRVVPVSNGENIFTAFAAVAQESAGIHF